MSIAIGIRFPAGRYHATPWDSHVNEAEVEWPPSQVRIIRALIAVWHRKADRETYPHDELRRLVDTLASQPPVFRLPSASLAHTRHYVPIRAGRGEKKTLIFDAFLRLDPDEELLVLWPDTRPDPETRQLLAHLAARMGYLGRAESWVECRVIDEWRTLPDCGPEASAERWRVESGARYQPVEVPVPLAPEEYREWRASQIEDLGLEKPRRVAEKRLRATLPDELVGALSLDTSAWRRAGWSRAPGTRTATYLRPEDCFPRAQCRGCPRPIAAARTNRLRRPRPRGRARRRASR